MNLDAATVRKDFPIFDRVLDGMPIVYLDSANTSQKPRQVIDAMTQFMENSYAPINRSAYKLAAEATDAFENARGKVARFANFGAFIELDDNLEGLCHISELSEERVARPEDVVQLGQELDFKVLRIDPDTKKIGLSARAVGKDEPIVDTKIYSSEAGGGMASLGELADFGLGKAESSDE